MIAGGYAARPFGRISVEAEVIGFRGVDALGPDLLPTILRPTMRALPVIASLALAAQFERRQERANDHA